MGWYSGKKVLLVGGSEGIGRATAVELARRGADVVIAARRVGPLEETLAAMRAVAASPGQRLASVAFDVTDRESVKGAVDAVVGTLAGLDVLILAVGGSGGLVVFDRGAPVHAEYREGTGEPALAAMIVTARRERAGRFCFIPGEPVAAAAPRTIDRTLSEVLVDIAPAGDDGEAAASRQPEEQ